VAVESSPESQRPKVFDSSAITLICVLLESRLMGPPLDVLQGLADFYAILAEIRNCPGVTPTIRLK
jgi:hypothetical protein